MKYFIKTFGCQMNYSDSERLAGFLEWHKCQPAKDISDADLVVFNTCGVRQMAEDRVYGQIHNLSESHPRLKIVLTGCLAERKDVHRRLRAKTALFFPINRLDIFESWLIQSFLKNKKTNCKTLIPDFSSNQEALAYLSIAPKCAQNFQAYVPIMTGCNNFCAYCVVPYARGREISRPHEDILKETKKLLKNGCKHIVLLGRNVNSYRGKINFSKLLKKIDALPGKFWLSFISNHPKDFSDELIKTATRLKKVCEFIHLPIQSGDDKVLEKMNRHYTATQYLNLVKKIKASFEKNKPSLSYSLTSDIIVGFPGETQKQFSASAKIMRQACFDMVYFGQYSPRPGTAAWKFKDNISKKEKSSRENQVNEILKKTTFANNQKYLGKKMEVLLDKKSSEKNIYFGRTRTQKNVKIVSPKKNLLGKIVNVKIIKANTWNLEGKIYAQ
jgi:tRNA-2-methylthio-N6-dimethylallyladenosine synthase